MSKNKAIVILAAWSALTPFLGFPSSWKNLFVAASGLLIVLISIDWKFLKRKKRPIKGKRQKRDASEAFVEHEPAASALRSEPAARPAADRQREVEEI